MVALRRTRLARGTIQVGDGRAQGLARTSFSFGGALYAWVYHAGVGAYLQQHGLAHPEARVYGTSAGVVPASFLVCGVDIERVGLPSVMDANDPYHYQGERTYLNPKRVRQSYDEFLALLPEDAHERASGRLFVVATELPFLRKRVVSKFPTRQALCDALLASAAIPGHGVRVAHRAKAAGLGWCVDGGIVGNYVDDNRDSWRTIRIGVWRSRSGLRPLPCRVHIRPSKPLSWRQRYTVTSRRQRMQSFRLGYDDAERYFAKVRLGTAALSAPTPTR